LTLFEKGIYDPIAGNLTYRGCIENDITWSDLEEVFISLPETLEFYNIEFNKVPDFNELREYQIDEIKLYETIVNTYKHNRTFVPKDNETNITLLNYKPVDNKTKILKKENQKTGYALHAEEKETDDVTKISNTIYRDVKVLSGVFRFRKGNKPRSLKDCGYLFITTNSSLAHASRRFEVKEQKCTYSLPTCLTDIFLGTLIWLQSPALLKDINEKKIIASCFASMNPNDKLITKYITEIKKLKENKSINEDQYYLLRTHRSAINILESKTMGDSNEFTTQTAKEILDELMNEIKKEELKKLDEEQTRHAKTTELLTKEKDNHVLTKSKLEIKTKAEEKRKIKIEKFIDESSQRKASKLVRFIFICAIVLLSVSFVVQIINLTNIVKLHNNLTYICWFIISILSVFNLIFGFNLISFKDSFFNRFYKTSKVKLMKKYEFFITD